MSDHDRSRRSAGVLPDDGSWAATACLGLMIFYVVGRAITHRAVASGALVVGLMVTYFALTLVHRLVRGDKHDVTSRVGFVLATVAGLVLGCLPIE